MSFVTAEKYRGRLARASSPSQVNKRNKRDADVCRYELYVSRRNRRSGWRPPTCSRERARARAKVSNEMLTEKGARSTKATHVNLKIRDTARHLITPKTRCQLQTARYYSRYGSREGGGGRRASCNGRQQDESQFLHGVVRDRVSR